jgi:hypothetical protein
MRDSAHREASQVNCALRSGSNVAIIRRLKRAQRSNTVERVDVLNCYEPKSQCGIICHRQDLFDSRVQIQPIPILLLCQLVAKALSLCDDAFESYSDPASTSA